MRVKFVHLRGEINKSAPMPAPANPENHLSWFRSARKAIPEIPDLKTNTTWKLKEWRATENLVVFELDNGKDPHTRLHDFMHIVIDRKASSLG